MHFRDAGHGAWLTAIDRVFDDVGGLDLNTGADKTHHERIFMSDVRCSINLRDMMNMHEKFGLYIYIYVNTHHRYECMHMLPTLAIPIYTYSAYSAIGFRPSSGSTRVFQAPKFLNAYTAF